VYRSYCCQTVVRSTVFTCCVRSVRGEDEDKAEEDKNKGILKGKEKYDRRQKLKINKEIKIGRNIN
jgi:hypothetical protein